MRNSRAGWLVAIGLAIAPGAQAAKVGGGLVLAAGELGPGAVGGLQAGAYFGFPGVERVHFGGDLSWYPSDGMTLFALDPNVRVDVLQLPALDVYPLAGFEILYVHRNVLGVSDTEGDVGLLVGGGAEVKAGPMRPFAEMRVAIHEHTYLVLSGGLRVAF